MEGNDPFGYMGYANDHARPSSAALEPDSTPAQCQANGPSDDAGTPKAPRLPFEGRPGRACPPAPKKGRAPVSFFDLSGEAPVRRLSFGNNCSPSSDDDDELLSDSMEEDECMPGDEVQQQQQQTSHPQQWQQQQTQPPQQQQWPSPSPQQQVFSRQFLQPQQLWAGQLQVKPPVQQQQPAQQQWCPLSPSGRAPITNQLLSPAGRAPISGLQGNTTPARLFR